jgi:hypothetical protein
MNRIAMEYRLAVHDYDEIARACRSRGGADLEDQRGEKEKVLLEKEEALAGWIRSLGF